MGRNKKMEQAKQDAGKASLPPTNQGDIIGLVLEITRVSNGYIVKSKNADPAIGDSVMVFSGANSHEAVTGHVLSLALVDMKQGEVITFESRLTYTTKIQNNESQA